MISVYTSLCPCPCLSLHSVSYIFSLNSIYTSPWVESISHYSGHNLYKTLEQASQVPGCFKFLSHNFRISLQYPQNVVTVTIFTSHWRILPHLYPMSGSFWMYCSCIHLSQL